MLCLPFLSAECNAIRDAATLACMAGSTVPFCSCAAYLTVLYAGNAADFGPETNVSQYLRMPVLNTAAAGVPLQMKHLMSMAGGAVSATPQSVYLVFLSRRKSSCQFGPSVSTPATAALPIGIFLPRF